MSTPSSFHAARGPSFNTELNLASFCSWMDWLTCSCYPFLFQQSVSTHFWELFYKQLCSSPEDCYPTLRLQVAVTAGHTGPHSFSASLKSRPNRLRKMPIDAEHQACRYARWDRKSISKYVKICCDTLMALNGIGIPECWNGKVPFH